jgi:hypothetical protein
MSSTSPPHRVPKPVHHAKPHPRGGKSVGKVDHPSDGHDAAATGSSSTVIHSMVEDIVAGEADYGDEEEQLKEVIIPPTSDSGNNIKVAVRCRPPNKREKEDGDCRVCVSVPPDRPGVVMVDSIPFTFDLAFPMDCTQLDVFKAVGVDIVKCACNGFNGKLHHV